MLYAAVYYFVYVSIQYQSIYVCYVHLLHGRNLYKIG